MRDTLEQAVLSYGPTQDEISALIEDGVSREAVHDKARKYISQLQSENLPDSLALSEKIARFLLRRLQIKPTGNVGVLDQMREGGVSLIANHFSYCDAGLLPLLFNDSEIPNVYYMGGQNVFDVPILGPFLKYWLTSSGLIPIKRKLMKRKERQWAKLYTTEVQGTAHHLLGRGDNLVNFSGRGRHRSGIEEADCTASPSIMMDSREIYAVTITYEIVPDEKQLFSPSRKKKSANIFAAIFAAWQNASGIAYVHFGEPVHVEKNGKMPSRGAVQQFHTDVTERLRMGVCVTPNNAFAYALLRIGNQAAIIDKDAISEGMMRVARIAESSGMPVSPKLTPHGIRQATQEAYAHFKELKAVGPNGTGMELYKAAPIEFYASQIEHGINHKLN